MGAAVFASGFVTESFSGRAYLGCLRSAFALAGLTNAGLSRVLDGSLRLPRSQLVSCALNTRHLQINKRNARGVVAELSEVRDSYQQACLALPGDHAVGTELAS